METIKTGRIHPERVIGRPVAVSLNGVVIMLGISAAGTSPELISTYRVLLEMICLLLTTAKFPPNCQRKVESIKAVAAQFTPCVVLPRIASTIFSEFHGESIVWMYPIGESGGIR